MVAVLTFRNCRCWFGVTLRALQPPVRAAIVAIAATIALAMPPAFAGLAVKDASSDPLKAAEVYYGLSRGSCPRHGGTDRRLFDNRRPTGELRPQSQAEGSRGDMVFVRKAN
jgi:hypothetical protein